MFYVTSLESAHDCDVLLLVGDPDFYAKMGHSVRSGDVPGWDGVRGVFFDVRKAFDTVPHQLHIFKTWEDWSGFVYHNLDKKLPSREISGAQWCIVTVCWKTSCIDFVMMKQKQRRLCSDI